MENQPFDYYKNKDVEYDVVLNADVNLDNVSYAYITEIIKLINNEDLLAMYFKDIALGRVYGKVEAIKSSLHFTFGISFIDAEKRPTSKDLLKDLKAFILSLNKNIEDTQINIKEGDVKVDILSENKNIYDNIDKVLVAENNLYFSRGNDIQSLKLTDDGIVEKYLNENLQETFPFSKLGITRECKTLITNGYSLTKLNEATITSNNTDTDTQLDLSDPEKTKQDLQQNINDVEEIQNLKNELDDKIDNLMEENKKPEEPFPSTDFTNELMDYSDIDVNIFNDNLTNEQKAYINTYIGTIDDIVNAMLLLYEEVGDTVYPMISLDDYIKEILEYDGGITEWSQELSDMLGFDLKTEGISKFVTVEKVFNQFLETAKEEAEDNRYTFKLSDLELTKEGSAEFKNLLLQKPEIEDVEYLPQSNEYTVILDKSQIKSAETDNDETTEGNNENTLTENYTRDIDTMEILNILNDVDTNNDPRENVNVDMYLERHNLKLVPVDNKNTKAMGYKNAFSIEKDNSNIVGFIYVKNGDWEIVNINEEKITEDVDQYKSSKEEFVNDLVKQIIDHFDDEYGWTRSDLQGYVSARCMTTGEDEDEILNMIDAELAKDGKGI